MKQVQLTDLVEIKYLPLLRSLRKGYTSTENSEPFYSVSIQEINEFGYTIITDSSRLVMVYERDLTMISSREMILKPYDILISILHFKVQTGIILDGIKPNCIANPGFAVLRAKDHQLRKEQSFNIFSFFISNIGKQFLKTLQGILRPGRRTLLSRVLIPLLEGNDRETIVNNIEQQIQKYKEIEKIKTEIDQIREKNGIVMFGKDEIY
jgi:hypothetical protein